ncbi:hypothetical Protein YC6258_04499 [Gynuella sunshinyii YC6258]|uniref:Uncharacterized protein n=1 Tax=Gynuella sunshinyii YC6258 TaxID=1445510 RepID=A0A0C5VQJ1_9GAMM|nr:hypothetical Protein YC6258_04499 [Gynuella sunshinyii YC6258]
MNLILVNHCEEMHLFLNKCGILLIILNYYLQKIIAKC